MDNNYISVGKELETFEKEKNDLLQKYNESINSPNTFEEKISTYMTAILYEYKSKPEQVLNSSLVYIINQLLTSTYDYKFVDYIYPTCYDLTGKLNNKYSIKTGTTDTDNLIFGYNQDIVMGIWAGYDNNQKTIGNEGKQIKQMWASTVEEYLKDKNVNWYEQPDNIVGIIVNPISGEPSNENNDKSTIFYYIKGTQPNYKDEVLDNLIPTINKKEEAIDQ